MKTAAFEPCPYCGHLPSVFHGVTYGGVYGDTVECNRADCPQPDGAPVWSYTGWDDAVRRWNEYATQLTKQMDE